jgi:hypothetical protein
MGSVSVVAESATRAGIDSGFRTSTLLSGRSRYFSHRTASAMTTNPSGSASSRVTV